MICNIVDRRKREYRWREINAIIEATSHDNGCADSDQQPAADNDMTYDQLEGVSLQEAIVWASKEPSQVTLYLYDKGEGV